MTQTENIKIDFLGKLDNLFNEIKREVDSRFEYIIRHESLITSCEQLSSKNLTFSNDNEALNKPTGFNAASSLFSSLQNRTGGLFGNSTTTPTGTGNVKFSALSGQDSVTKNGVQSTIQTNHQCITAMKNYQRKSLEELRLEDYQANRKFPQTTSGFGTSSGLFGSSVQSASSGFGSSSLFNSSSTAAKPFGCSSFSTTTTKPSTSTSSFGSQTKPVFGTSATIHPFVVFENSSQRPKPSLDLRPSSQSSTGLFGTRRVSYTGNGLFGPLTPPTMTTGGPLGSSTQQSIHRKPLFGESGLASIFGHSTNSPLITNKPFGSFSAESRKTKIEFGSPITTTQTPTELFSSIQQNPTFGFFKTTQPSTISSPFGAFGTPTQPSMTTTSFEQSTQPSTGLFGTSIAPTTGTSLFGSTTPSTSTTGGLFGSSTQQNQQQKTLFGGFGSTTTNTASTTPAFSFGTSTTQPSQPASSVFGQSPFGLPYTTTSPSFSKTINESQTKSGFTLDSNEPSKISSPFGGFGTSTQPPTPVFRQKTQFFTGFGRSTETNSGNGLFGTAASTTGGLFGSSTQKTQEQKPSFSGFIYIQDHN